MLSLDWCHHNKNQQHSGLPIIQVQIGMKLEINKHLAKYKSISNRTVSSNRVASWRINVQQKMPKNYLWSTHHPNSNNIWITLVPVSKAHVKTTWPSLLIWFLLLRLRLHKVRDTKPQVNITRTKTWTFSQWTKILIIPWMKGWERTQVLCPRPCPISSSKPTK